MIVEIIFNEVYDHMTELMIGKHALQTSFVMVTLGSNLLLFQILSETTSARNCWNTATMSND